MNDRKHPALTLDEGPRNTVAAALERPGAAAAVVGFIYLLLSAAYIVLSSFWASLVSADVETMRQLEVLKGILFCVFSGLFLSLVTYYLLRMVRSREEELLRQRTIAQRAERSAVTSVSVASIAHDNNNLLGISRSLLDSLPQDAVTGEPRVRINQVQRLLEEMLENNRKVIESTRSRDVKSAQVNDLAAEVGRAVSMANLHETVRGCPVKLDVEGGIKVKCDSVMLHQAVVNLLINAAEAAPAKPILVRAAREGAYVVIEVHDSGPGIPEDDREKVFRPYFSSKSRGSGLGLVTVQGFAEVHRGKAEVGESQLGGACLRLKLPLNGA